MSSLFFLELAMQLINNGAQRPWPYGVPILGGWAGYSAPAPTVGILMLFLMGIAYCLVVPGRPRSYAKAVGAIIVVVLCLACLYLAVDHVEDVFMGMVLGVAIAVTAFRFSTPNEVATTVDSVVAFMPRSALVGYVRRTAGLALCGRGTACAG